MDDDTLQDSMQEVLQRTRRTETKVTLICQSMGIDGTPGKTRMTVVSEVPPIVELASMDVSFGDVLDFAKKRGKMQDIITVTHRGKLLGSVVNKETA